MINILTISIGLSLLWSGIYTAPSVLRENITQSFWENVLNESTKLQSFQLHLLSNKTLPFLDVCYSGNCCLKSDQIFCPIYYEMVIHLNQSKKLTNFTEDDVRNLQLTKENMTEEMVDRFCANFSEIIPERTFKWNSKDINKAVKNKLFCAKVCINSELSEQTVVFTLKPFCKMISWMAGEIANETSITQNVPDPPENAVKDTSVDVNNNNHTLEETANATVSNVIQSKEAPGVNQVLSNIEQSNDKKPEMNTTVTTLVPQEMDNAKNPGNPEIKVDPQLVKKEPAEKEKSVENTNKKLPKKPVTYGPPGFYPPDFNLDGERPNNDFFIPKDDSEDVFQTDTQKSDPLIYSNEDENEPENIRPPQADTKQTIKDPTIEEIIETKSQQIMQRTNDGVSANYIPASDPFYEEAGSNFFTYFLIGMFVCILLYVLYHNKTKVLALILEGRRSQKGRGSRRKHTAQYRKLDTNLEEAITSSASGRSAQIIY